MPSLPTDRRAQVHVHGKVEDEEDDGHWELYHVLVQEENKQHHQDGAAWHGQQAEGGEERAKNVLVRRGRRTRAAWLFREGRAGDTYKLSVASAWLNARR